MSKKILLSWLFMAILCLPVLAQIQEPVKFKTEWKSVSADEVEIVFTGKMEKMSMTVNFVVTRSHTFWM